MAEGRKRKSQVLGGDTDDRRAVIGAYCSSITDRSCDVIQLARPLDALPPPSAYGGKLLG
jgi:hypothetical protein